MPVCIFYPCFYPKCLRLKAVVQFLSKILLQVLLKTNRTTLEMLHSGDLCNLNRESLNLITSQGIQFQYSYCVDEGTQHLSMQLLMSMIKKGTISKTIILQLLKFLQFLRSKAFCTCFLETQKQINVIFKCYNLFWLLLIRILSWLNAKRSICDCVCVCRKSK